MPEGGLQRITASGVVGTSGKPIRLYGYQQASAATGPGLVNFLNGTVSTSPEIFAQTGSANGSVSVSFGGNGIFFPAGLYVKIDADVTYVTVNFQQTQST